MSLLLARDPAFDARWASWLSRGVAHDRAVRRRLAVAMPFAVAVMVVVYTWLVL
jgi:hypothetical protein